MAWNPEPIKFYSGQVRGLLQSFPSVFDQEGSEGEESSEENGDGEKSEPANEEPKDFNLFSFLCLIKRYLDITNEKWKEVYDVNIYNFFNIVSFSIELDKKQEEDLRKWKNSH